MRIARCGHARRPALWRRCPLAGVRETVQGNYPRTIGNPFGNQFGNPYTACAPAFWTRGQMSRGPARFKQSDVARAMKGAKNAGVDVRVEIAPDGKMSITGKRRWSTKNDAPAAQRFAKAIVESTDLSAIPKRARGHRGFRDRLLSGRRTVREARPMTRR